MDGKRAERRQKEEIKTKHSRDGRQNPWPEAISGRGGKHDQ
jgi:hypothetical protein